MNEKIIENTIKEFKINKNSYVTYMVNFNIHTEKYTPIGFQVVKRIRLNIR